MTHSYHIFYFPFKWNINGLDQRLFAEQVDLNNVLYTPNSLWERIQKPDLCAEEESLYNEKNFFYRFVHPILYDEVQNPLNLIRHFERKEPKISNEIYYYIKVRNRDKPYRLTIKSMNINLYATGVGFLSFYLSNDDESQSTPDDILSINQYGRRIMPPFYADIQNRYEVAEYIRIEGLYSKSYFEDFKAYSTTDSWQPASFVKELIGELASNISIEPVVDDRMFVACWYKNDQLANEFTKHPNAYSDAQNEFSDFWYRYLFVDGSFATCQNDSMKKALLDQQTYLRWQKLGSLYGVTRYSIVFLTNHGAPEYLLNYFETIYARMVELVLVQRASILRFSAEITLVSKLSRHDAATVSQRISSLYKEYIHFVNQVHFREITAQDQGIELYALLHKSLNIEGFIKDLDDEIDELQEYVALMEDREQNKKAGLLNNMATLFLPVTVITGFWGMVDVGKVIFDENTSGTHFSTGFIVEAIFLIIGTLCALCVIYKRKRKL